MHLGKHILCNLSILFFFVYFIHYMHFFFPNPVLHIYFWVIIDTFSGYFLHFLILKFLHIHMLQISKWIFILNYWQICKHLPSSPLAIKNTHITSKASKLHVLHNLFRKKLQWYNLVSSCVISPEYCDNLFKVVSLASTYNNKKKWKA